MWHYAANNVTAEKSVAFDFDFKSSSVEYQRGAFERVVDLIVAISFGWRNLCYAFRLLEFNSTQDNKKWLEGIQEKEQRRLA